MGSWKLQAVFNPTNCPQVFVGCLLGSKTKECLGASVCAATMVTMVTIVYKYHIV